jgi:crotonobetainyl-CoA:carnitine CoA-transferase CaiB-like acyl-CoA transferase
MARRGLDHASLSALNPGLIMASVSGFGQTGAFASRSCFDFIAQAYSGLMHLTGEPDGPPIFVGAGMGDTNAGVHAFAAIGYALYRRERTGKGTYIDISMIDALFHMQEQAVQAPSLTGGEFVPMRQGRHYQPASPAGSFKGPEGWIVLLCTVNQIANLWEALGRPELAGDERFAGNQARIDNRAELTAIIEDWMATFDTDAEVIACLESHRVPCGPVLNPADAATHPYFVERGAVRKIQDPLAGELLVPGFPIRFADRPEHDDLVTPDLGQHNAEVLSELLGYDAERVAELERKGLLGSKDR